MRKSGEACGGKYLQQEVARQRYDTSRRLQVKVRKSGEACGVSK